MLYQLRKPLNKKIPLFLSLNGLLARASLSLMSYSNELKKAISDYAKSLPEASVVLDAGAGQCQYKNLFSHCRYIAVDSCVGDPLWDFSCIDICSDLSEVPLPSKSVSVVILTEVLEHLPNPALVLAECYRLLSDGGEVFITVPVSAREHQVPFDFYRYTRFGLYNLLDKAGFSMIVVTPIGGDFDRLYGVLFEAMSHFSACTISNIVRASALRCGFLLFRFFLKQNIAFLQSLERSSSYEPTPPLFVAKARKL